MKRKAAERATLTAAEGAVRAYGLPVDIEPSKALLDEVHRTAGHIEWLSRKVADLQPDELVWGVVEETDRPPFVGDDGEEFGGGTETKRKAAPNVWLELYQRERRHLVDVCRAALAAGVEERRVRLAEEQGVLLASVIKRILDQLDLTPGQRAKVPLVVTRELRAVTDPEGA